MYEAHYPEIGGPAKKLGASPTSYWDHVRRKMEELEKRWLHTANLTPAMWMPVPQNRR
jgi:hypothetical protein